jgi:hypothetical protein
MYFLVYLHNQFLLEILTRCQQHVDIQQPVSAGDSNTTDVFLCSSHIHKKGELIEIAYIWCILKVQLKLLKWEVLHQMYQLSCSR